MPSSFFAYFIIATIWEVMEFKVRQICTWWILSFLKLLIPHFFVSCFSWGIFGCFKFFLRSSNLPTSSEEGSSISRLLFGYEISYESDMISFSSFFYYCFANFWGFAFSVFRWLIAIEIVVQFWHLFSIRHRFRLGISAQLEPFQTSVVFSFWNFIYVLQLKRMLWRRLP